MDKLKLTDVPARKIHSDRMLNQSVQGEPIKEFFSDLICDDLTNKELKVSLIELEELVESRTRQYVKTIELLRQEVSQRQRAEQLLQRRDAILKAVSYAAEQIMLKYDWQVAIHDILRQLGQAAAVSRVYVFQNQTNSQGEHLTSQLFEWTAPGIEPQIDNPELQNFSYVKNGFEQWQELLEQGEPVFGLLKQFPKVIQEVLIAQDIQSIVVVPIMFKEKAWGVIGFDHCTMERHWSELEIDALKTAANIIGGAIQREKLEQVLRKSRARYRAVIDSQIEMICRMKINGTITFVNDAYCRYLGKGREQLVGNTFFPFNNKKERKKIDQLISSLSPDNQLGSMEHQYVRSPDEVCWHKWTYRKIYDDEQHAIEYQAVGLDITKQKQAEQQLQKVLDEQEELIAARTAELRLLFGEMVHKEKMAALGVLISGIAHEINNPNNFISFNIPILENYIEELTSIVEQYIPNCHGLELLGMTYPEFKLDTFKLLKNLEHGSSRINTTVSHLRTFARPHNTHELRMVDLKSLLNRSIELCQSKIKKTVKQLELDVPKFFPKIFINPYFLEQVIVNLLINAAQSADKKDSFITIKVAKEKKPKGHFSIRVEDNGSGMDEKTKNTIFAPFYTTKEKGGGSGLGLYVSQSLIQGLGGAITVESKPGKGSCFQIILPRKKVDTHQTKLKQSFYTSGLSTQHTFRGKAK
jgi:PAS domain S-box-containing protein